MTYWYNDTGIQLGKIGWIIDRFEWFVYGLKCIGYIYRTVKVLW